MATTTLKDLLTNSKGKIYAKTEAGMHRVKLSIGNLVETEATENSPEGSQYLPITLEHLNGKTDIFRLFLNGFNTFSNEICQQLNVKELDLASLNGGMVDVWISYTTGLLNRTYQNFHFLPPQEQAASDNNEEEIVE